MSESFKMLREGIPVPRLIIIPSRRLPWRYVTASTVVMLITEVKPEAVEDRNRSMMSDVSAGGSAAWRSECFMGSGASREKKNRDVKLGTGVTSRLARSCGCPDSCISANDRLCSAVAQVRLGCRVK